jgi:DNA-binding transcriptional ArsR family regulator
MENIDATAFRALANQRRLAVLALLGRGERSVGKLQRLIGIGQSAVSQHLARLRAARLVRRRRDGQTIYYRLDVRRLAAIIAGLSRMTGA